MNRWDRQNVKANRALIRHVLTVYTLDNSRIYTKSAKMEKLKAVQLDKPKKTY